MARLRAAYVVADKELCSGFRVEGLGFSEHELTHYRMGIWW